MNSGDIKLIIRHMREEKEGNKESMESLIKELEDMIKSLGGRMTSNNNQEIVL